MTRAILLIVLCCLVCAGCDRGETTEVRLTTYRDAQGRPSISSSTPIIWMNERSNTTLWPLERPIELIKPKDCVVSVWYNSKMFVSLGVPDGKAAVLEYRGDESTWLIGYQEAPEW